MSLLVKFNLILILCFGIALVPANLITRDLLQKNARTQVVQHARLMMQTALATRGYTNKQIKPLLAARLAEEFLPQTVPGVLRDGDLQHAAGDVPGVHLQGGDAQPDQPARPHGGLGGGRRQRIPLGREAPGDHRRAGRAARARALPGPADHDHRPGLSLLPHHARGDARLRREEVRHLRRLRLEVERDHRRADRIRADGGAPQHGRGRRTARCSPRSWRVFAFVLVLLNLMLWFTIIRPIRRLSQMADEISTGNLDVPEVRFHSRDEVAVLAGSFNRMRISLVKALKMLEEE